ncbi:hypothetical protein ES332_A09G114800v1 [Gossypium tomentosum]|uniref:Uncharacterized protein n=1 Tax=Gossypium tomentosum TaxID=34277 RepID=A0A5D2P404_GOSTO|nr:hypothetical protein ES332_A09G114800v1 [Gossypium tomentosum]
MKMKSRRDLGSHFFFKKTAKKTSQLSPSFPIPNELRSVAVVGSAVVGRRPRKFLFSSDSRKVTAKAMGWGKGGQSSGDVCAEGAHGRGTAHSRRAKGGNGAGG